MNERRHIVYVSGTRADFGLMETTLKTINDCPALELSIVVTGMHLDPAYGHTVDEIVATGLRVASMVEVQHGAPSGGLMAQNLGRMLIGFVDTFALAKPDLVLLLGDRGEMLAAAIAALHLNIPIAHIHGGERSGTVDEPVRHAVSKLSHLHLVATTQSRERLIRMGEEPDNVLVVGAPGLDGLEELANASKADLFRQYGLDPGRRLALLLYHPVLQEIASAESTREIINALLQADMQILALRPNSDAGSAEILAVLDEAAREDQLTLVTHLRRTAFVSFLRHADLLIGNSSSGIIEAATFGTPVINIGNRQHLRERNDNVIDVPAETQEILLAVEAALAGGRFESRNNYGDGRAAERIIKVLRSVDLTSPKLMMKTNVY